MEKRSITVSIWTDAWFEELTAHQKLVWLHLLTHTNSNMFGFFDISIKRISSDCSLEKDQVLEAFEQFAKDQKAFVYGAKIWLCNFLKHQTMNPNMMKNARSVFDKIPEEIKQAMKNNNLKAFETIMEGFGMVTKGFGMVTEPLPNHSPQEKRREELREEKKREEKETLSDSSNFDVTEILGKPSISPVDPEPSFEKSDKPKQKTLEEKIDAIYALYPKQKNPLEAKREIANAIMRLRKESSLIEQYAIKHKIEQGILDKWSEDVTRFIIYKVRQMKEAWFDEDDLTYCPSAGNWFAKGAYLDSKETYRMKEPV